MIVTGHVALLLRDRADPAGYIEADWPGYGRLPADGRSRFAWTVPEPAITGYRRIWGQRTFSLFGGHVEIEMPWRYTHPVYTTTPWAYSLAVGLMLVQPHRSDTEWPPLVRLFGNPRPMGPKDVLDVTWDMGELAVAAPGPTPLVRVH